VRAPAAGRRFEGYNGRRKLLGVEILTTRDIPVIRSKPQAFCGIGIKKALKRRNLGDARSPTGGAMRFKNST